MEKMIKKRNKKNEMNEIDMENVEKILIKNLENKKDKKNNSFNTDAGKIEIINHDDFTREIINFNKSFPEDNPIPFHFNRNFDKENLEQLNAYSSNKSAIYKHSSKLYNQKIGEYSHSYFDCKKQNKISNKKNTKDSKDNNKLEVNFARTTVISKFLIEKNEPLENILPEELSNLSMCKIDLNTDEFFNLRFFKYLNNYCDISLFNSDLFLRQNLMNIYLFHILNHVLIRKEEIEINNLIEKVLKKKLDKTMNNILKGEFFRNEDEDFLINYVKEKELTNFVKNEYFKEYSYNTSKITKILSDIKNISDENTNIIYDQIKDQGFTSPRVLILVPYKKHARLIIDEIINILKQGSWKGVMNKKKFKEDYSEGDSMNDCFRIGISIDYFTKKIKFYQPFEESDIIIASPLGVKLAKNSDGDKQEKIYDFLSSIEILLVDFSEVFIYQNIDHLEEVLGILNKIPKSNQNIVDINRIKDNYKDNFSIYLRQTIFVSHFKNIELEFLIKNNCKNIFQGTYNLLEKYQNVLFEKNNIEKDLENSKQLKKDNEIYDSLQISKKKKTKKISDLSSDEENEEDGNENHTLDNLENNKIKFEFKILRSYDDMDILDNKFNFFTKNVKFKNYFLALAKYL